TMSGGSRRWYAAGAPFISVPWLGGSRGAVHRRVRGRPAGGGGLAEGDGVAARAPGGGRKNRGSRQICSRPVQSEAGKGGVRRTCGRRGAGSAPRPRSDPRATRGRGGGERH